MPAQRIILLFVDRRPGCVDVVAREIAVTPDDGVLGDQGQEIVARIVSQSYEPRSVVGHEDSAVSRAGSRRFGGKPDFGEPPGGSLFPRGIHPGMPFLFQISVMRGFAVGVYDDICVGNLRAIPDILGIEPCAAVRRFEIALLARRFVEFQQVDPLGGETCPSRPPGCRCVLRYRRRRHAWLHSDRLCRAWPGRDAGRFSRCGPLPGHRGCGHGSCRIPVRRGKRGTGLCAGGRYKVSSVPK